MINFDEMFTHDILSFIKTFGYTIQSGDNHLIEFIINKVCAEIKNECNVLVIPDGLRQVALYMVSGEFLFFKKRSGQLTGFNFEACAAVKQIQEGDTSVTFAVNEGVNTPEQKFDAIIEFLRESGKGQLVAYRKLKW